MSQFIDNQAEESEHDNSDASSLEDIAVKKKQKRVKKRALSSDESGNESGEERKKKKKKKKRVADSDEEDEGSTDEDDRLREEMKDFVVDPGEEGEEEGDDDNDEERSKSGSELEEDLEEDDLELVNENIGVQRGGRVVLDSDEEDDDRQRLRNDLFGLDDDEAREERDYGDRRSVGSRSDSEESEKFIVEDDEDRGHRKKRHRHKEFDSQYVDDARDVFGVDDIDDFYDEDEMMMEEDMEDEEQMEGRVPKARVAKQTLLSAIEPSELDKGFLTAFDKRVIFEDRPERFQLRRVPVTEIDEAEVQQETLWIKEYAFEQFPMSQQVGTRFKMIEDSEGSSDHREVLTRLDDDAPKSITQTLLFVRNQLFEVPFIAFYRKEFIQKSLKITDLWKIFAYDEKYCLLDMRKRKLRELYERMAKYIASCGYEDVERLRKVEETDYMAVNTIRTVEELADVTAHFQLYYGHEVSRMSEWEKVAGQIDFAELGTKFRMSGRSDKYLLCVNNGLGDVARLFGLNPEEFAFNYSEYPKYELQTHVEEAPQEVAHRFSEHLLNLDIQTFPSADDVLKGASYLLASQISRQPSVRKKLRKDYRQRLLVSVRCTKKGREEIDRNNPLFGRRYIKDKPVSKLVGDEYLEYIKAQNLGLVEVKLYTDKDDKEITRDSLLNQVPVDLYQTDDQNDVAQEWNKHRREVMRIVVEDLLGPVLEREAHERLMEEARGHVMRAISQRVMARVAQAPYRREFTYQNEAEEEGEPEEATVRIMGIAYSTDPKEASFAAVIDQDGTMKRDEYQRLPNFFMKANRNNPTHPKTRDMEMLRDFIIKTQPHVVALAGEGLDAIRLQLDLKVLIKNMYDQGELPYSLPVEFVNCDIAKVYMISQAAQDEMPMYPPVLRESICLARCLLDPLVEFCHLCNTEDDILFVKFHALQDEIPKQDVLWTIHRELIDRVNEVGVDINRCLEFPHTAAMLQFVCGLGPRKAAQLLKILKQNDNLLESRTKLVTYCRMGPKVFMNAAGFIKIDTNRVSERTDADAYVEVLDGSRVHPETYEWARKMAVDALEFDDSGDPTAALEEILRQPERLKDLDLDAFAEELQRQGFGDKSVTLYDIRAELNSRYKDLRPAYRSPDGYAQFEMLVPDSSSMKKDNVVTCQVVAIIRRRSNQDDLSANPPVQLQHGWRCQLCERSDFFGLSDVYGHVNDGKCMGKAVGVKVRLDNGLMGFISAKNISDKPTVSDEEKCSWLKEGQIIHASIIAIDYVRLEAQLSSKSSDLRKGAEKMDANFWTDQSRKDDEDAQKARESQQQRSQFVKRVIAHPSFHNITYKDAEDMLRGMEQGEVIVRPSGKSHSHLTVTWKVADDVYQHITVKEEQKESHFSLGKVLYIGNEQFEDLDEILARYIHPMAAIAREIMQHKYFLEGTTAENVAVIQEHLKDEKKRSPGRIPYVFTPSTKYPGKFVISYLVQNRVRSEYITTMPNGLKFRSTVFTSINELIDWFKQHFREPPPNLKRDPVSSQLGMTRPDNPKGVPTGSAQSQTQAGFSTTGFGQSEPSGGFAQPPSSGFGNRPSSGVNQRTASGFGRNQSSGFGQNSSRQNASSRFGQNSSSGFDQNASSGFGQTTGGFGQQPPASGFGQPQAGFATDGFANSGF